jgi:hypothetical protein
MRLRQSSRCRPRRARQWRRRLLALAALGRSTRGRLLGSVRVLHPCIAVSVGSRLLPMAPHSLSVAQGGAGRLRTRVHVSAASVGWRSAPDADLDDGIGRPRPSHPPARSRSSCVRRSVQLPSAALAGARGWGDQPPPALRTADEGLGTVQGHPALTRAWSRSRHAGKNSRPARHRTSSSWRCDQSTQGAGCGRASLGEARWSHPSRLLD